MKFENLPVYEPYLTALRAVGFRCDTHLKWQNLASGRITWGKLATLRAQPFVRRVSAFPRKVRAAVPVVPVLNFPYGKSLGKVAADSLDYGVSRDLFDSLRVDKVHAWLADSGLPPGQGVRIAIIDADFYLGHAAFTAIKQEHRVLDQWDFVAGSPQAVIDSLGPSHGGNCLSLIGGNLSGTLVGVAPAANFLVYRAENINTETFVEEDYVAAAIERAVDSGAQVISISLGYRYDFTDGNPDYPFSSMDGRTLPASLAALGAARRNVLVVIAAGNLPGKPVTGPTIVSPADADSILTIGIADRNRQRCAYACMGPTFDGRIKPEVVSMGPYTGCQVAVANTATQNSAITGAGTSFAAPVVAGIAALVRQIHPEWKAMEVRAALMATADGARYPNDSLGWGMVDALKAAHLPVLSWSSDAKGVYYRGIQDSLVLRWDAAKSVRGVEMTDLLGRPIAVSNRQSDTLLFITPKRDLRTGIYLLRVRSRKSSP